MERIGHLHKPSGRVLMVLPADKNKFRLSEVRNLVNVLRNEDLMFCCLGEECVIVNLLAENFVGNELNVKATTMLNRKGVHKMVYGDVLIIKNELLNINHDRSSSKKANMPGLRAQQANILRLKEKEKTTQRQI